MIKVVAPDLNFTPFYMSGKWWDKQLIQFAASRGCQVQEIGEGNSCLEFSRDDFLDFATYLEAAADGFTIYNWPCFLSLDASKFNDPVPEGLVGRSVTDEEGVETILTWAEWGSTTQDARPILSDGTRGIPLVLNYRQLTNVECAVLDGLPGHTLLDKATFDSMKPQTEEEI